jgi:hypothetical protein
MITFIHKEVRLVRTAWIVALLLAIVPVWFQDILPATGYRAPEPPWWLFWFGAGALLLGLAPFGQEFNFNTFNLLLVQPQERRRLFFLKTATAAVAMLSVWLALYLSCQFRFAGVASAQGLEGWLSVAALAAVVAFSSGLWTTLFFRQITASLLFTLFTPLALIVAVSVSLEFFNAFHAVPQVAETHAAAGSSPAAQAKLTVQALLVAHQAAERREAAALSWVMLAYSVAGLWWARRQFLGAQEAQWAGGVVSVPSLLGRRSIAGQRRGPTARLIGKELQLQQIAVLFAFGLAGIYLAAVLMCSKDVTSFNYPFRKGPQFQVWLRMFLMWFGIIFFVIPGLMGATAVAEERRLGVMESFWHIPMGRLRQFVAKLGVVLFLTFLLGAVMPSILDSIAAAKGVSTIFREGWMQGRWYQGIWFELAYLSAVGGILAAISFYASTLCRNTGQALGVALGLCLGVGLLSGKIAPSFLDRYSFIAPLLEIVGGPVVLIVFLCLSYNNYKRLQIGKSAVVCNAAVWLGALVLIPSVAFGIYFRSWERVMALEPSHGAPQLNLFGRASILEDGAGVFVLLPDGRLWASQDVSVQHTNKSGLGDRTTWVVVPQKGTFIGGANWADVVQGYDFKCLFGTKSDGTLWKISPSNLPDDVWIWSAGNLAGAGSSFHLTFQIERIGTDSDWTMLCRTHQEYLALKRDGSLWGWGYNEDRVLGDGPEQLTNGPVRIGNDSDWAAVSAGYGIVLAIKSDGSVWKWGNYPDSRNLRDRLHEHATPVRWTNAGTNWVVLDGPEPRSLALHQHGGMWAFGGQFGEPKLDWIGPDTEWRRVENGRPFPEFNNRFGRVGIQYPGGLKYYLSKYADWVTPSAWPGPSTGWPAALAADGTLSTWDVSLNGILGPSRRPLWSINILKDKYGESAHPPRLAASCAWIFSSRRGKSKGLVS